MFNNDTWKKIAQDLGDKWAEVEAELILKINFELAKDMTLDKVAWSRKRLNDTQRIAVMLEREARKYINPLTQTLTEGLEVSTVEAIKEVESVVDTKLTIPAIPEVKPEIVRTMNFVVNQALNEYRAIVTQVPLDPDDVFTQVKNASREIIDRGFKTYANGRTVTFRSYMEMKGRTDLNNNALRNLEETSRAMGVGYFLASEHFDSADDHAKYQGKFYLADGVVDEWNGKYMYLSEAKANGFLTRPNCRHYVMPVTKEQLGKVTTADLKAKRGEYKADNYEVLQDQRKNERMIVKYKNRLEADTIILNQTKDPTQRAEMMNRIAEDKVRISDWQRKQRETISGTPLKRDYRREQPGRVVRDLGAKYRN
jgi:hypothetical protein